MVTENQSAGHSSAVPSTAAHVPASRSQPGNTFRARSATTVTRKRDEALPFVVTSSTKRGRYVSTDYFDPEISGDRGGYLSGLEALAVLLAYLEKDDSRARSIRAEAVLIEAGKKATGLGSESGRASFAVFSVVSQLLQFAARHADWRILLADRIAMQKSNLQSRDEMEMRHKREFVSRMRAAKAAKRSAALQSTVQTSEGAQQ